MTDNDWKKLESIIDEPTIEKLQSLAMFKNENTGAYELFAEYEVKKVNNVYCARKFRTDTEYEFGSLQSALTWVILDKRNMIAQASRIVELDRRIAGVDADLAIHRKLENNSTDVEVKALYLNKLQTDRFRKRKLEEEMKIHVSSAYNWQMQKFEEASKPR